MNNDEETVRKIVELRTVVKTIKGAPFRGVASGWYYNDHMKHYGIVVIATHGHFKGVAHVYPAVQLEEAHENT